MSMLKLGGIYINADHITHVVDETAISGFGTPESKNVKYGTVVHFVGGGKFTIRNKSEGDALESWLDDQSSDLIPDAGRV